MMKTTTKKTKKTKKTTDLNKITYKDIKLFKEDIKKLSLTKNVFIGIAIGFLCLSTISMVAIAFIPDKNKGIIFIILTAVFAALGVILLAVGELLIGKMITSKEHLVEKATQYKNENKKLKTQLIE